MSNSKVAIIYLSYHSDEFLPDAFEALKKLTYPKDRCALIIVDNPHPKYGSSESSIRQIVSANKDFLPVTEILVQTENKGFCGGNNIGIRWAIDNGYDYAFLHNQDGYLSPDCIELMVREMETDSNIGCAQAMVMLHGTEKINTAGNSFSYLGFGYIPNFGVEEKSLNLPAVQEVGYASGAALMMRLELVKKYGDLDEELFAYHEDIEYSLRMKYVGFKSVLISRAKFFHKYVFNRNSSKFYFMERNRYALLLMYYKWPTLILLLPIIIIMEVGMDVFFIFEGWLKEKVDFYRYWFNVKNIKLWLEKRKNIQNIRMISDRKFISTTSAVVSFGEKQGMNNPLLKYIANPLMVIYKFLVQLIIFW